MNTAFDAAQFATPHAPLTIGAVSDRGAFDGKGETALNVQYLLLKKPGEGEAYLLPQELAEFRTVLQQIIDYEHAINPLVGRYYAVLTIDRRFVAPGEKQRRLGAHIDSQYRQAPLIDRVYAVCSRAPTAFYIQPFAMGGVPAHFEDYCRAFDGQKRAECIQRMQPYEIALFDSYSVHEPVAQTEGGWRTFLRVTYTTRLPGWGAGRTVNLALEGGEGP
jgi:hypothetical protein